MPGILLIGALAGIAVGIPITVILIFGAIVGLPYLAFLLVIGVFRDWLGRFPEIQVLRQRNIKRLIEKKAGKGFKPLDLQNKGLVPDNRILKQWGFSQHELVEFGLESKIDDLEPIQEPHEDSVSEAVSLTGTRELAAIIGVIAISVFIGLLLTVTEMGDSGPGAQLLAFLITFSISCGSAVLLRRHVGSYKLVLLIYLPPAGLALLRQLSKRLIYLLPR